MKTIQVLLFLFFGLTGNSFSQNLLPLNWKISFNNTKTTDSVNLLLSWERQGYFWHHGSGSLSTYFNVPKTENGQDYALEFSLQCNVLAAYLNDQKICGEVANSFWVNRGNKTRIVIPEGTLKPQNQLVFQVADLSYTGGISHNICTLKPVNRGTDNWVSILFAQADHIFATTKPSLSVLYKSENSSLVQLTLSSDFHEPVYQKKYPVKAGEGRVDVDLSEVVTKPGFYECTAILNDGSYVGNAQWFGFKPENISCAHDTVSGFKAYWQQAINELKRVEPSFTMHKVDSLSSAVRDGYVVEMKSAGNLTIRGYYFVPKKEGRFAALLHVPGYGWGFDNAASFAQNTDNVIELAICVRGHGISADVFNPGFGTPGIWGWELCSKQNNAYHSVYMDCLRAVDFLLSRPEVDTNRIGVMGGSQGGGLTLVTAGLYHDKIAACAYFDPFPTDIKDFIAIRQQCKTEIQLFLDYYQNKCGWEEAMAVQEMLNNKGFAHFITCPVYFATALFDDDSPPHVGFAAYNLVKSAKQYKVYPNDSHLGESDYYSGFYAFFKEQFGY